MSLSGVLSAVRQLVLDEIDLSANQDERRALYASRFTGLTELEVADLAKMEPARLALYTNSVFTAEGSILQRYFPLSYHRFILEQSVRQSPKT